MKCALLPTLLLLSTACNTVLDHPPAQPAPTVAAASVVKLPAYNADIQQTSVSGISSGGYFAVQMHVAFSSIMKGAGVFAGGPYHCAGSSGNFEQATTVCETAEPNPPDVASLIAITDSRAASGDLDPTSNLAAQNVWLFTGTKDNTVLRPVMDALQQYYQHYVTAGNIFYETTIGAGHAHITDSFGSTCAVTQSPYINNCDYDGAGLLLQQIYGTLNPRNTGTLGGQLIQFDQSQFIANPGSKSMDTSGWAFVPADCAAGAPCKVHVAFHGCKMYQGTIGDDYYAKGGYNEWADTNHIIVLYPQTVPSNNAPLNPLGCWDWWGYNGGTTYDIKSGDQMAAIKKMIDQLTSGHATLPAPTGLTATGVTNTSVSLSWNSVTGASTYQVSRASAAAGPFAAVGSPVSATSLTDSGLTPGTAYYYEVQAVDNAGNAGAPSAVLSVTTSGTPPALPPPTGVAVSGTTSSSISLTWNSVTGAAGYNVFRSTSAGGMTTQANGALISGDRFTDSGLASSTTYYYVVTAQNGAGAQSAPSSQVSGTTASAATCYTDNNWNHYLAGRATFCLGDACAVGSKQNMGLLNILITTTLKETAPDYYVIGTCN